MRRGLALTGAVAQSAMTAIADHASRPVGRTHNCAILSGAVDPPERDRHGPDPLRRAGGRRIDNVTVTHSSGSDRLDRAAVDCVSKSWRNTPARLRGVAVPSPGHVANIQFLLHDDAAQLYAPPSGAQAPTALALHGRARRAPTSRTPATATRSTSPRYGGALAIAS